MFNEQVYNDFLREIQDNSEWLPLGKQSDDFEIHQHSAHMTRFKIRAEFGNSIDVCFKFCTGVALF